MWLMHYNKNHDPENGQFAESSGPTVRKRISGDARDFQKHLKALNKRNEKLASNKARLTVEYRRAKKRKDTKSMEAISQELDATKRAMTQGNKLVRQIISDANYAGLTVNSSRVKKLASVGKITAQDLYKGDLPDYVKRNASYWSSKYEISGNAKRDGDAYVQDTAQKSKYSSVSKKTKHYNLHQLSVRVKDLEYRRDQASKAGDQKRVDILTKEIEAAHKRLSKGK